MFVLGKYSFLSSEIPRLWSLLAFRFFTSHSSHGWLPITLGMNKTTHIINASARGEITTLVPLTVLCFIRKQSFIRMKFLNMEMLQDYTGSEKDAEQRTFCLLDRASTNKLVQISRERGLHRVTHLNIFARHAIRVKPFSSHRKRI